MFLYQPMKLKYQIPLGFYIIFGLSFSYYFFKKLFGNYKNVISKGQYIRIINL